MDNEKRQEIVYGDSELTRILCRVALRVWEQQGKDIRAAREWFDEQDKKWKAKNSKNL